MKEILSSLIIKANAFDAEKKKIIDRNLMLDIIENECNHE